MASRPAGSRVTVRGVAAGAAVILLMVHPAILADRSEGTIAGRVATGAKRAPVPLARVTLAPQDDTGPPRVTETDGSGRYLFEDVRPGLYRLSVVADHFEERR